MDANRNAPVFASDEVEVNAHARPGAARRPRTRSPLRARLLQQFVDGAGGPCWTDCKCQKRERLANCSTPGDLTFGSSRRTRTRPGTLKRARQREHCARSSGQPPQNGSWGRMAVGRGDIRGRIDGRRLWITLERVGGGKTPALKVSFERELTSTAVPSRNERRAAATHQRQDGRQRGPTQAVGTALDLPG